MVWLIQKVMHKFPSSHISCQFSHSIIEGNKILHKNESYAFFFLNISIQLSNFPQMYFMTNFPLLKKSEKKWFYILHFLKYHPSAIVSALDLSYVSARDVKRHSLSGKTIWQFYKKLSIVITYSPTVTLLSIYHRKMKPYEYENLYIMALAALFVISQTGNHPDILQQVDVDGLKKLWYNWKLSNKNSKLLISNNLDQCKSIMLTGKKKHSQKIIYCIIIPFVSHSWNGKSITMENRSNGNCQSLGLGKDMTEEG